MPYIPNFKNRKQIDINNNVAKSGLVKITDGEKNEREKKDRLKRWVTYFRQNPARFAVDYLGIKKLKYWQRLILHIMFVSNNFLWIASRGLGKTWLVWLYCVIRCILYPRTKIVYTSVTMGAATQYMMEKIAELKQYPNIASEIEKEVTGKMSYIQFKNGSTIRVTPPNNNARGARAHVIVIDEYRLVSDEIIKSVYKQMFTSVRQPLFLEKTDEFGKLLYPDYPEEENIEIYISSQAPTYEIAYNRYVNTIKSMMKMPQRYAMCIPYYLGVKDKVINKKKIMNDLKEEGADMQTFALEYECIPFGENSSSYFTNSMFQKCRTISKIFVPMTSQDYIKYGGKLDKNLFYIPKVTGELRLLCVDTALGGKDNNCNTIVECLRLIPKERKIEKDTGEINIERFYEKELVYIKNVNEDLNPHIQAKIIKRIFYLFEANTLVVDSQGTSLGVVYALVEPTADEEYGLTYPAYDSINDENVSDLCKESEEQRMKIMYNIKVAGASAIDIQHKYNTYTREQLLLQHIKFPTTQGLGEEYLSKNKNYDDQDPMTQAEWISIYRQMDALVLEAISLEKVLKDNGSKITLEMPKKSITKRRDRIIALQYGLLYAQELERKNFTQQKEVNLSAYYNRQQTSTKKQVTPFGNNFNRVNGFGWNRKR